MTFDLSRIAGEVTEPISLDEAKLHLRVDGTAEDDLIGSMITSARESCERLMQRSVVPQSWMLTQSGFGRPGFDHRDRDRHRHSAGSWGHGNFESISLPRPPIQSVTSVAYLDESRDRLTLDPSRYRLAVMGDTLAFLRPVGLPWPHTACEPDAVSVTYLAGWSDPASIPSPILSWIKLRIGSLYACREEFIAGLTVADNPYAAGLLDPYSIPTV